MNIEFGRNELLLFQQRQVILGGMNYRPPSKQKLLFIYYNLLAKI